MTLGLLTLITTSYIPSTGIVNRNEYDFKVVVKATLAPLIIEPEVPLTGARSTLIVWPLVVELASILNKYLPCFNTMLKGLLLLLRIIVDKFASLVVTLIPLYGAKATVLLNTKSTKPVFLKKLISLGTVVK